MKRFVLIVAGLLVSLVLVLMAFYQSSIHLDFASEEPSAFVRTEGERILLKREDRWQEYIVRGVNMGQGLPGEWATDYAIDRETYLRWLGLIQELGANTVRVYTIQTDDFYNAFFEYNTRRVQNGEEPLYLLQGVWVNDYVQNSHVDALDASFKGKLIDDTLLTVDVIHGRRVILKSNTYMGSGFYVHDVSPWVLGYVLGVEWEDVTVAYTNEKYPERSSYQGQYLTTTADATPFEAMLAELGDRMLAYESSRYGQPRLFAFSNWPTTDPFEYPEEVKRFFRKCACVDVEHIRATDKVISGQFASYHVYPYYQDFLSNVQTESWPSLVDRPVDFSDCFGADGSMNTYRAYLKLLSAHHAIPVVITEFGVSTGRGMAQRDANTGRNQGNMSEREQGDALVACWEDLRSADCSGGCVFSWQDEWFKRTWNTMHAVDLSRTPYWSDYQTNEQYFGLLSFDPSAETWVCALDGDISEWSDADVILSCEDGSSLSMKYDERYLYFRIHRPNLAFGSDTLVLPIDVTPKTGSTYSAEHGLQFERACDFLIVLHGREDSRVLVQDRCNALMANYSQNVTGKDVYLNPPDKDSPHFEQIHMILQTSVLQMSEQDKGILAETFETGLLRYGDGNPDHAQYDSLADFICRGDEIELRLPWQLLNFADPSRMSIHDDCYDGNYGIEFITAEKLYVGLGALGDEERIAMGALELTGWGNRVQYHERLKPSYFILQDCWTGGGA